MYPVFWHGTSGSLEYCVRRALLLEKVGKLNSRMLLSEIPLLMIIDIAHDLNK